MILTCAALESDTKYKSTEQSKIIFLGKVENFIGERYFIHWSKKSTCIVWQHVKRRKALIRNKIIKNILI